MQQNSLRAHYSDGRFHSDNLRELQRVSDNIFLPALHDFRYEPERMRVGSGKISCCERQFAEKTRVTGYFW